MSDTFDELDWLTIGRIPPTLLLLFLCRVYRAYDLEETFSGDEEQLRRSMLIFKTLTSAQYCTSVL